MLSLTHHCRYFLYLPVADMRKGFDGLYGLVRNELGQDPLSGDVFIFMNRRRNQVKLLSWESGGLAIYSKRLERGTYELPGAMSPGKSLEVSAENLLFILEGIQLSSVRKRKRYIVEKIYQKQA